MTPTSAPSYPVSIFIAGDYDRARQIAAALPEIRGKNLACWCALDAPCHADVLLELTNATPDSEGEI